MSRNLFLELKEGLSFLGESRMETKIIHKYSDGRKYVFTYWNESRDKVKSEAINAIKNIDMYRDPHIDREAYVLALDTPNGVVRGWAIDIAYYGVD